jgi:hypothetical protein
MIKLMEKEYVPVPYRMRLRRLTSREIFQKNHPDARKKVRQAAIGVLAGTGLILLLMTETSLSCGIAGTVCMATALLIKR